MSKTNPARGMRDFLPADIRKRNYVIGIIKEVYESYGFEPLETPAVENLSTLIGKYGEEGNQLIYKILKRGEKLDKQLTEFGESKRFSESENSPNPQNSRNSPNSLSDLALRYDLTVPLARVVANNRNELPKFFKRYQIQPVWRADRPARGRFREFYQCDVDAIGSDSMVVEAELISAVSEILQRLGFEDFVIRINDRRLLSGMLSHVGIPTEFQMDSLVALDKLDKIGADGVTAELIERGIPDKVAEGLILMFKDLSFAPKAISIFDEQAQVSRFNEKQRLAIYHDSLIQSLEQSKEILSNSQESQEAFNELIAIVKSITSVTTLSSLRLDPSLARGLSYYTGAIFEINVPDLAGSLGGGGRYDGLIGMFGKEQIPACGFSLGLERILVVMDERGMFPPEIAESSSADIMVAIDSEDTIAESLRMAAELRKTGLRVLVYPEPDKLGKQFKYADSIKVRFVCIPGEGIIKFKDLTTGEQKELTVGGIARLIGDRTRVK